jgi:hypothetical protein
MSRIKPSQPHAAPPVLEGQVEANIDREGQPLEHGAAAP